MQKILENSRLLEDNDETIIRKDVRRLKSVKYKISDKKAILFMRVPSQSS